jgi:arylsulfatase A-like enzyme
VLFYEWVDLLNICPDKSIEKQEIKSDLLSAKKIADFFIEKKPIFIAVAFDEPDNTGHSKRWGSRAYYTKLNEIDSFISIIEQAVKVAGVYDNTVFMISADHGGSLWGHKPNFTKNRMIPLVIFGSGIKEGFVIPSPISICDIAPTMTAILGLDAPSEWTGNILTDIFE